MKSLCERFNDFLERSPVDLYCALFIITLTCTVFGNYLQNDFCKDLYPELWGICITVIGVDIILKQHDKLRRTPIVAQKDLQVDLFTDQAAMVMSQFINPDSYDDLSSIDKILDIKHESVGHLIAAPLRMLERTCYDLVSLFDEYLEPEELEALLNIKLNINQVSSTVDLIMIHPNTLLNDEEQLDSVKKLLKSNMVLLREAIQQFQKVVSKKRKR